MLESNNIAAEEPPRNSRRYAVSITSLDERGGTQQGQIEDADSNCGICVMVPHEIAGGTPVRIETPEAYAANGKVVSCVPSLSGHRATIALNREERRAHSRIPVREPAHVTVIRPSMPIHSRAWVTDVSEGGLGLSLRDTIAPGSLVRILLDGALIFGEVRHCSNPGNGEYRAGVQIQTVIYRDSNGDPVFPLRSLWTALATTWERFKAK